MYRRAAVLVAAGLALGAACSDDTKQGIGAACANNTDCADSICHSGICVSKSPLKNGAPCQGDAYCKSLTCSGGICAQGSKASGATCLHAEECAVQSCRAGLCFGETPVDAGPPDRSVGSDRSTSPDLAGELDGEVEPVDQQAQPPDTTVTGKNSGVVCDPTAGCSNASETCLKLSWWTKGMCLDTCSTQGAPCPSADPTTMLSYCIISDRTQTTHWCAYICEFQSKSYKCPDATSYDCVATSTPGTKICTPK